MAQLTVIYSGELAKDHWWPPIMEAARYVEFARTRGLDRIRVERVNGALINEYSLAQVDAYLRDQRLIWQPDRVATAGQDYEPRRPQAPGWSAPLADKEPA